MPPIRVLIADDHRLFRRGLRQVCEMDGGFEVVGEAEQRYLVERTGDLLMATTDGRRLAEVAIVGEVVG